MLSYNNVILRPVEFFRKLKQDPDPCTLIIVRVNEDDVKFVSLLIYGLFYNTCDFYLYTNTNSVVVKFPDTKQKSVIQKAQVLQTYLSTEEKITAKVHVNIKQ